jgi:glycosyltransferase involved in cell wall biosynthesis
MSERRLRVVMLIESVSGGGAERFTVGLARAIEAEGCDVVVCASRDAGRNRDPIAHAAGVRVLMLGRRRTLSPLAWLPLVRHLRRERVDVLHSHMFGSNVWAVLIGRLARVPVVIATEHSWTYEGQRLRKLLDGYWIGRLATAFVAVSPEDARRMVAIERVPARRVRTIATGLLRDPAELQTAPGDLREELGLAPGTPLVGAVAMLRPMKAVDVLVEAFARLRQRVPEAHLAVAGDGPLRSEVEAQVAALGVGDAVHLLGVREDVANVLRSLDVVVMPSDSEGSPIALIEAMVAGRAIVASCVGGMPWILDDGRCGVLVPPRAPEALAHAVTDLLGDPARRDELGARARRRARADFTLESVAGQWAELYRELRG